MSILCLLLTVNSRSLSLYRERARARTLRSRRFAFANHVLFMQVGYSNYNTLHVFAVHRFEMSLSKCVLMDFSWPPKDSIRVERGVGRRRTLANGRADLGDRVVTPTRNPTQIGKRTRPNATRRSDSRSVRSTR